MTDNLQKINDELEIIDQQVHSDFAVVEAYKHEKTHFLKQLYQDKKQQKITKEEYLFYKKEAKKIFHQDLARLNAGVEVDFTKYQKKYEESLAAHNQAIKKSTKKIKFYQITPQTFTIIALVLIPIFMTIGLLLNYLLVAPVNFSDQNSVIGFSISMFIIVVDLIFLFYICRNSTKKIMLDSYNNAAKIMPIGFIANFCDVLGIGSFATNTNLLKVTRSVKNDKTIPGTLNTGMAISNLFTGCLFIGAVQVEMTTLIPFVVCAVVGSFIGSRIVNKVNTRVVQLIMGVVLACTAVIMLMTVKGIELLPSGTLKGVFEIWWKFIIGCLAFIVLGIFMSFGVGLYAPAMAIISLLGIDFLVVFPIMTVSAGLTMHVNGYRYSRSNNYLPKTSFCMTLGGIIGVITSFSLIFVGLGKGLGVSTANIKAVFQWLSVPVISYASFLLLRGYVKATKKLKQQPQSKIANQSISTIDYQNFNVFVNAWSSNLASLEIVEK